MPRNGSGQYTLPEPAFVPNNIISSAAVNADLSDIASALTDSIAADGQTPITGAMKLVDGSVAAPSYTFITGTSDGIHHPGAGQVAITCAGTDTLTIEAPGASTGGGLVGVGGTILCPIGSLADFAGSAAPTGWFLCYGQALSRTTYTGLFGVVGTTFGSGDGSTTFNLPDLRGCVAAGKDDMGGTAANRITNTDGVVGTTLGSSGGEQTHTLITAELAAHSHTASVTDPSHYHAQNGSTWGFPGGNGVGVGSTGFAAVNTTSATTGISVSNANAGGGGAHNNLQPTMILNKIIFAGHA